MTVRVPLAPDNPWEMQMGRAVLHRFSAEHKVPVDLLTGKARHRYLAHKRQDLMLKIREETTLSLPQIGRLLNRDHSTIVHGIRQAKHRRERAACGT